MFCPDWECSTRKIAPVSGSRVIFAVVGVNVLGVRDETMVRGSGLGWACAVEVLEGLGLDSVPPAREFSLEVRPRRR